MCCLPTELLIASYIVQLSKKVTVKRIIIEYPESAPANFDDTFHVRIHKLCCVHLLHEVYRLCLSDVHPLSPSVCLCLGELCIPMLLQPWTLAILHSIYTIRR